MTDNKKYPRPNVKIINCENGAEEILPMPDDDYAVWLQNCLDYEQKYSETA